MSTTPSRRAFSLIELLVVIAIIAVLMALILAAVQRVREAGRRTECLNKIRQQALAVLNYESSHGHLPPGAVQGPFAPFGIPEGAGHGMWVFLLPHIEQVPVANCYRLDIPFDHANNQPAATARLTVLLCPIANADRVEEWESGRFGGIADYVPIDVNPFLADIGIIDPVSCFDSALQANKLTKIADVIDGTSNTLLLAEATGRGGTAWSSPLSPTSLRQVFGGPNSFHRNGTTACLVDGSARFIPDSTDLHILGRLSTRAGGEVIGDW